jgi:hypothetical protein
MEDKGLNATHLFKSPKEGYHSSESFWTSLFAFYILTSLTSQKELIIPAYRYCHDGSTGHWWYEQDGCFQLPSGLSLNHVIVEGKINSHSFPGIGQINKEYLNLRPDIIVIRKREICIVEIKTVGHRIGKQKFLYERLVNFLKEREFHTELFFLLSIGHESESDWRLLRKNEESQFRILLWERVLEDIVRNTTELGGCLGNISKYYESIKLEGWADKKN